MLKLNPYKIGFRTIKTAVGMTLGVIISKLLGLDNYASSAILVVLCIKHTKVHSLQAIISRLVSCFLVLFLGSAIFSLLGQSPIVLGIIVLQRLLSNMGHTDGLFFKLLHYAFSMNQIAI